ncbi:MAG: hypothetical protein HZC14_03465 [Candidatus Niyogibacteria bacterium]|nr:hypothetical protein [Candidatus Niyogibacteria bacterium]
MGSKVLEKHHRYPTSSGGTDEPSNISYVSSGKHAAWHLLFKNYSPVEIANIINTTWLDPDYIIVVTKAALVDNSGQNNQFIVPLSENARERRKRRHVSQHHRRPKSLGGSGHAWNISEVEQEEHAAWHILFSNMIPEEIVAEINAMWLDRAFNFTATQIADVDSNKMPFKRKAFLHPCYICGEHHQSEKKAKRCKRRGFIVPRYTKGERVRISIPKKEPECGVIIGWHTEDSANPHTYEFYTVKLDGGETRGVFAYNMQVLVRGKWIKRRQVMKKSKQKRDRWLRKKGF